MAIKISGTTVINDSREIVDVPSAIIGGRSSINSAPGNLFSLPGAERAISLFGVGPQAETTEVQCVADVNGDLAGEYFILYGPGGTSTSIDTVLGEQSIHVWFQVSGSGTQPTSGAGRYIQVDFATNSTAAQVALAISNKLNTDAAFKAGVDGDKVIIVAKTTNNFTNSEAGNSGFTVTTIKNGDGSLSGTEKWAGGVLASNGKIYGIPHNSTAVLEIDPETRTATTFGSLSGTNKWYGGVLAPNGKIYGIPWNSTSVLEIDPETRTATTFGTLSGTEKWTGGVLASNGKIYGIPRDSTSVLEIDPETRTATTFGSLSGAFKWAGGVLASNGKIYGIPHNSTAVLEVGGGYSAFPDWYLSAYYNKF